MTMKIELPFAPVSFERSGPRELAANATRWMSVARRELPPNVGCVMIFFPKDGAGRAQGVLVGNVPQEALIDELKAVVRRWTDQQRIIIPEG